MMAPVSPAPAEDVCPAALALAGSSVMQFAVLAALGLWCGWSPLRLPPSRSSVTVLALERLTPVRTMVNPPAVSSRPVIAQMDSATPPPMPTLPTCQAPTAARVIRNAAAQRPRRVPRKPVIPVSPIVSVSAAPSRPVHTDLPRPVAGRSDPAPPGDRPGIPCLADRIARIRNLATATSSRNTTTSISSTIHSVPAPPQAPSGNEVTAYLAVVRERLERAKRFPESARKRGFEGTVLLA
ncbi:MAG TPA: hypothetical protein PLY73_16700, partial [Candidatus Ozemobacteraceae bacterium]|nr:hypothetical protein [Candidatus Ozemobacteraceae bacterium]